MNTVPQESNDSIKNHNNAGEIERMVEQYGDCLLRLCCIYTGNLQSAEDALQETFIKAFQNIDKFRHQCSEKTWLTTIAINVCRSCIRQEKIQTGHIQLMPDGTDSEQFADSASEIIYDDTVLREIHRLKPKYREVILMYYYQEMKSKEIASALGISESAVTVRLSRAREQLKTKLKDWYYD